MHDYKQNYYNNVEANLDKAIVDIVDAYDHNLPDALELVVDKLFASLADKAGIATLPAFAHIARALLDAQLKAAGYNEDEIVGN